MQGLLMTTTQATTEATAAVILTCGYCSADVAVTTTEWLTADVACCDHCGTAGIDVAWHRSHADLPDDDTDNDY